MNWNLRNQILVPISIVFLLGIAIATSINVAILVQAEKQKITIQVNELFDTIESQSFPLTDSVLRQIESISTIHLIVQIEGKQYPTSFKKETTVVEFSQQTENKSFLFKNRIAELKLNDIHYLVFKRDLQSKRARSLFALFPKQKLAETTGRAIWPPVITGLATLIITFILIIWISRNVTEPIRILRTRVGKIADGNFEAADNNDTDKLGTAKRHDEIGELFRSICEMATKLKDYEARIRVQEKLFTLDQMGGGIAHQMRNSITGCRLALDIHKESCTADAESLAVADRQLRYMEDFQKRFLASAREPESQFEKINLSTLIKSYTPLLNPISKHVAVELAIDIQHANIEVNGNQSRLEQMLNNLLHNAIEAASGNLGESHKQVFVYVKTDSDSIAELIVADNGKGVANEIQERLFEPLATTKADGVGLGLSIVKQIVDEHLGTIQLQRNGGFTEFVVRIPLAI